MDIPTALIILARLPHFLNHLIKGVKCKLHLSKWKMIRVKMLHGGESLTGMVLGNKI